MSFCTACGASVTDGAQFCSNCGTKLAAAQPGTGASVATRSADGTPPAAGGGGLKVVLTVAGVLIVIGILALGVMIYVGYRIAGAARAARHGGGAVVETPFGTVQSSGDSARVARDLRVDIYPGARVARGGASVRIGRMSSVTAVFESDDPADKVADFYKGKFPDATYAQDEGEHTIVATRDDQLITITIEPQGRKTRFTISRTGK